MRSWIVVGCLCLSAVCVTAQIDEAANANALYHAGKKLEALPLYEASQKGTRKNTCITNDSRIASRRSLRNWMKDRKRWKFAPG